MELKDWLNSVNFTKEDLSEDIGEYPPYIVNKCLSGHIDCIMYANEMNINCRLDKDMQYSFYLNSLRKKKRFSPWLRKETHAEYGYLYAIKTIADSILPYDSSKAIKPAIIPAEFNF